MKEDILENAPSAFFPCFVKCYKDIKFFKTFFTEERNAGFEQREGE